ncbi:Ubiquitin-like-specific protease 2 [Smittium culicis]|uniref:Ubiquitin-like-specific protease 2 n=1 Tax=Smittium culicis TaxID=133412 RepID=A0A1R1XJX0_9FUNG|nr:Ubiquitin-like-specific protease 2 [Smittium culicis]
MADNSNEGSINLIIENLGKKREHKSEKKKGTLIQIPTISSNKTAEIIRPPKKIKYIKSKRNRIKLRKSRSSLENQNSQSPDFNNSDHNHSSDSDIVFNNENNQKNFKSSPRPSGNVKKIFNSLKSETSLLNSFRKEVISHVSIESPKKINQDFDSHVISDEYDNETPKSNQSSPDVIAHKNQSTPTKNNSHLKIADSPDLILSDKKVQNPFNIESKSTPNKNISLEKIDSSESSTSINLLKSMKNNRLFLLDARDKARRNTINVQSPIYTDLVVGRLKSKGSKVGCNPMVESKSPTKIEVPTNRRISLNSQSSNVSEIFFNKNKNDSLSSNGFRSENQNRQLRFPSPNFKFPAQIIGINSEFFSPSNYKGHKIFINISSMRKSITLEGIFSENKEIPLNHIKRISYSYRNNNCLIGIDVAMNRGSRNDPMISERHNSNISIKIKLDTVDIKAKKNADSGNVKQALSRLAFNSFNLYILTTYEHDEMLNFLNQGQISSVSLLSDSESDSESSSENAIHTTNTSNRQDDTGNLHIEPSSDTNKLQNTNSQKSNDHESETSSGSSAENAVIRTSNRQLSRKNQYEPDTVLFVYPFDSKNSVTVTMNDFRRLHRCEFLNDTIIDFYLRFLLEHLKVRNPALFSQVFVYSSFFYELYNKNPKLEPHKRYEYVKKWTSKVNMADKKYLFFPINKDQHWFLAVIINPLILNAESKMNNSESKEPNKIPKIEKNSGTEAESEDNGPETLKKDPTLEENANQQKDIHIHEEKNSTADQIRTENMPHHVVSIDLSLLNSVSGSRGNENSSRAEEIVAKIPIEGKTEKEVDSDGDDDKDVGGEINNSQKPSSPTSDLVSLSELTSLTKIEEMKSGVSDLNSTHKKRSAYSQDKLYDSDEINLEKTYSGPSKKRTNSDGLVKVEEYENQESLQGSETSKNSSNKFHCIDNSSDLSDVSDNDQSISISQSSGTSLQDSGSKNGTASGIEVEEIDINIGEKTTKKSKFDEFDIEASDTSEERAIIRPLSRITIKRNFSKKVVHSAKEVEVVDPDSK